MANSAYSIGEAKKHFSELLNRVAYGGGRITIAKRGKPLAMLVPPVQEPESDHLSRVKGWLENSDPFFEIMDQVVRRRQKHFPPPLRLMKRYNLKLKDEA